MRTISRKSSETYEKHGLWPFNDHTPNILYFHFMDKVKSQSLNKSQDNDMLILQATVAENKKCEYFFFLE
jgi:hypothetical protein